MVYLRFGAMTAFLTLGLVLLAAGGHWPWVALLAGIAGTTIVDELVGNSRKVFTNVSPVILNAFLYLTLPLIALLSATFATFLSDGDPLGLVWLSDRVLGVDLAAIRARSGAFDLVGAGLTLGLFYGAAGVNVAHELFHRAGNPYAVITARWLLAFTCDTTFAIEHVHGHHRNVATDKDPATARRGEYVVSFFVRSTVGQFRNAFAFEAKRLKRQGRSWLSPYNRALRGQFMSLALIAAFYWAAGWTGVLAFLGLACIGKLYLESVDYIEHYGLVRIPGTRIEERHSWDCYRLVSNAALYNLPRHSEHHLNAAKRYWELETNRVAPTLPHGYMTMILMSYVPSLWHRAMDPLLKHWDETHASEAERALIAERGWKMA
jgi:alkane 1-monooxygenase